MVRKEWREKMNYYVLVQKYQTEIGEYDHEAGFGEQVLLKATTRNAAIAEIYAIADGLIESGMGDGWEHMGVSTTGGEIEDQHGNTLAAMLTLHTGDADEGVTVASIEKNNSTDQKWTVYTFCEPDQDMKYTVSMVQDNGEIFHFVDVLGGCFVPTNGMYHTPSEFGREDITRIQAAFDVANGDEGTGVVEAVTVCDGYKGEWVWVDGPDGPFGDWLETVVG
jgi:hypothetical protein